MLVLVELILVFAIKNPAMANCARLCAQPYTNGAAILLFILVFIHLFPTHFFLYSFYIIPRRFYASNTDDMKLE